jgi:hypothetical protein
MILNPGINLRKNEKCQPFTLRMILSLFAKEWVMTPNHHLPRGQSRASKPFRHLTIGFKNTKPPIKRVALEIQKPLR